MVESGKKSSDVEKENEKLKGRIEILSRRVEEFERKMSRSERVHVSE